MIPNKKPESILVVGAGAIGIEFASFYSDFGTKVTVIEAQNHILPNEDKDIFISDQEILSLISAWKSQVGRNPTEDELARIINNLVDEEILYREALNLGLDQEDKIIKRRLAQKISFLKEESIPDIPSSQELQFPFQS